MSLPSTAPMARTPSLKPFCFLKTGFGNLSLPRWHVAGLHLQVIALVAQGAAGAWCCPGTLGAPRRGQLAGSDGPSALGAHRRAVCTQPPLCLVRVGAKGVRAAGQP